MRTEQTTRNTFMCMKLVTGQEKHAQYLMKPNFKGGYPLSKELFAVEMGKTEIKMNKPVYLQQAILDFNGVNV